MAYRTCSMHVTGLPAVFVGGPGRAAVNPVEIILNLKFQVV